MVKTEREYVLHVLRCWKSANSMKMQSKSQMEHVNEMHLTTLYRLYMYISL